MLFFAAAPSQEDLLENLLKQDRERVLTEEGSLNEKTYAQMQMIAEFTGSLECLPELG